MSTNTIHFGAAPIPERQSTTDDADVHIVKTTIETYEKIKKQVVLIGQDVDRVLPTALSPDYKDILKLKECKGKVKDRVLWKGKTTSSRLLNHGKYLQDIPEIFNNPKSTCTEIERAGEVHRIVQQHEESSSNKMRHNRFNELVGQASSAILFSKLPPTTEAAHQHCSW
ncbi:hypothetical protein AVEN_25312-1 [Araneus ventricosus]|uniref:Uncharacterized protein n=1 Tax=Araneus ventricosus TaxID=182803 RepID=A0A4Y2IQV5_ARAVE|nr:hypothetical protein AVEN_25312-1 [Araneus ventricosus]